MLYTRIGYHFIDILLYFIIWVINCLGQDEIVRRLWLETNQYPIICRDKCKVMVDISLNSGSARVDSDRPAYDKLRGRSMRALSENYVLCGSGEFCHTISLRTAVIPIWGKQTIYQYKPATFLISWYHPQAQVTHWSLSDVAVYLD